MPAKRSRTHQWRRCLSEIHERGGSLEITIANQGDSADGGHHLIWRVRILELSENKLIVEQPSALGQTIHMHKGAELVAILSIGQNRWMFNTTVLGRVHRGEYQGLQLAMPTAVERCQRRNYYRIRTAELTPPEVDVWPLLDPKSVVLAERSNELQLDLHEGGEAGHSEDLLPEVGPRFRATLVNIGGGGLGLHVRPQDAHALSRHKLFWLKFALPPRTDASICATAKLAHTHMQAQQDVYAGVAFDFSFNPGHQRYVVEQICQYIAYQQKLQFESRAEEPLRKSA